MTGIPDPVEDHATILTEFTFDARDKVREVCARLEGEGLDTGSLDMRFGIHSGATTAGILRGTKSRFELFGDTINTASRMESTGMGGKIQVSEDTAELLRKDGQGRWLSKRKTLVAAKGKGDLQTYWVEPESAGRRVSFSEKIMNLNFITDSGNSSFRRSSRSSDRFYQHEFSSSVSSCGGQLPQWDEEKLDEDIEQGMTTSPLDLEHQVLNEAIDCNSKRNTFAASVSVEPSSSWERPSMTNDEESSTDENTSNDIIEGLHNTGMLNLEVSAKPESSRSSLPDGARLIAAESTNPAIMNMLEQESLESSTKKDDIHGNSNSHQRVDALVHSLVTTSSIQDTESHKDDHDIEMARAA